MINKAHAMAAGSPKFKSMSGQGYIFRHLRFVPSVVVHLTLFQLLFLSKNTVSKFKSRESKVERAYMVTGMEVGACLHEEFKQCFVIILCGVNDRCSSPATLQVKM